MIAHNRTDIIIEQKVVEQYINGNNIPKISKNLNLHNGTISNILKRYHVSIRKISITNRKYDINEHFFDNINCEKNSYFLGLLYADGYNNTTRGSVHLSLQELDKDIIIKFNTLLQPTKPVQIINKKKYNIKHQNQYRIVIDNKYISQHLQQIGCINKKSKNLKFPLLDPKILHHFIRGYFDGNGSISYRPKSSSLFSITGYDKFIIDLQKILCTYCNINITKLQIYKNIPDIVTLRYCGGPQLCRIRDYLYQNSTLYIQRKYDKFFTI